MSVSAVRKKRQERLDKLSSLNNKLKDIENDSMYSPEYKLQQIRQLRDEMNEINSTYDQEIKTLVQETRSRFIKGIDEEKYSGDVSKQLLIEMQNQRLADELFTKHKTMGTSDHLLNEARNAVENNLSNASGYVSALKRLDHKDANRMAEQLEINNRTPLQKDYYKELESLQQEEKAYQADKVRDNDPMKAALMDHYS